MNTARARLIASGAIAPRASNTFTHETTAEEASRRGLSLSQVRRERAARVLPDLQDDLRAVAKRHQTAAALDNLTAAIRARSTH